ncbi:single-stranded-DNA-specific exonuclease RecJ [Gemmata sp. G18]|uniref:Single-stranded-DNA-specific exonuclease RecJ n=1 Tax=Gemmata palustris TaxID=2822762 RepID=A0ABS5C4C7_9BACT|nr:single-stranded-DNA-specific exonuclease RecJ [Gemmata palustris]MBP3960805.1 single-stranded-DNA-specific exonuclease RecJ [Gemmata palustris]
MARAEKQWHLLPSDPTATNRLAGTARVSSVVAQLLINRGVRDAAAARRFLETPLGGLLPPMALPGVRDAADRIARAITDKRRICVYGDYDVDGVTGTSVLLRILGKLGADVQFHVPLRLSEGYGLNSERLRDLQRSGVSMVVSVDCGIASLAEAQVARDIGLELIITDHHEMKIGLDGPILPLASVLVHPRLPAPEPYPFGDLSGAGVAFKLAWAVAQRACGSERVPAEMRELLLDAVGLAALGLVADVVPLRDENRIFVRHGLERIRTNPSTGLKALLDASGVKPDQVLTSEDVGFKLAPRLNAAGRLGCASFAVELLTTTSGVKAVQLAQQLEAMNSDRQAHERKYTQAAKEMVEEQFANDPAIVVGSTDWHPGVVGIVASRLVDYFGKPALVIAIQPNEAVATGSARSVPGFALHTALVACDDVLEGHGGHAAAAGFKVRPERIPALRDRFNAYVTSHYPGGAPAQQLTLDAEVPLSAITFGLLKDLDKLEPYGAANPKPKFLASGLKVEGARLIGTGEVQRHMDFRVRQGETTIRCVAWGMADRLEELMSSNGDCCLAFTPKINEWKGYKKIELQVIDLKPGKMVSLV